MDMEQRETTILNDNISHSCVGTASKPVFSNKIYPMHTLPNVFTPHYEIDSSKDISSSILNEYSSTGLIHALPGQCCISQYFSGMNLVNFTANNAQSDQKIASGSKAIQDSTECGMITISRNTASMPVNRCADNIIQVANNYTADSQNTNWDAATSDIKSKQYFKINDPNVGLLPNSIGCVTACPVTDSLVFDMDTSFSGPHKHKDWYKTQGNLLSFQKAQYNPYISNDTSWNCIRIPGGGPFDAHNAYCCSFLEMIPVPINAYKNFGEAFQEDCPIVLKSYHPMILVLN